MRNRGTVEQRNGVRQAVRVRVAVLSPIAAFGGALGQSENLSAGGMFLVLKSAIADGAAVELLFELPAPVGGISSHAMRCVGRVVRVVPLTRKHGIAIAFEKVERLPPRH
jgi:c-di-GMP-binding flagellar brake protein YcgR